jgi:hypothetical protein
MKQSLGSILTLTFTLLFLLNSLSIHAQWVQVGPDIDGVAADDQFGYSVSMPDVNTIAIGSPNVDSSGNNSGQVRIFRRLGNNWIQKGADINGEGAGDRSGWSVSMPDSNTVAIGATMNFGTGAASGHVRIYRWNGSAWIQKGTDIDGEASLDQSGTSVSMPDSNTVAIGAPGNDAIGSASGHVRVYAWNGSTWLQKGIDIDGENSLDQSGWAVSMPDPNTLAIGAISNDGSANGSGHVRVYSWNGSSWIQKGGDIDGETSLDGSGAAVSMPDPNTLAIGAPSNDGNGFAAGHVRVYSWNGNAWAQKGADIDGEAANDESGWSVSMADSNTLAIGAPANDGNGLNAGHVRVFSWNGSSWVQKANDIDGEATMDNSGFAVCMSDTNMLAIGARLNDGAALDAGHIRVFRLGNITSLNEVVRKPSFSFYPNPTDGELIIDLDDYHAVSLQILDLSGKVIQQYQLIERRSNLDLSGVAEGVYFVRYGEVTKKLVIAR